MGGAAATEPPSVSLSFANNFWGKDDAGVGPMLDRMHAAKVTNDELKNFYAARAAIEEEYSRKLLTLSRKPLGSCESGTLRMSCDIIRGEVESMGKAHQSIAQQMKTELEEPLAAFSGGMKERRKIVQNGIEKLLKLKMQQTSTVNKARDRYEQDCLKIKGFLAQAHMVMGHEERKNKARLEKTQINLATTSSEYEAAIKVLEETTGRWNRDWKAACDKFQDLEEERIDYTKSSLWNFANIASTVCVSDDAGCEKMRLSLEDCEVEKDITSFIKESGTGQEIPDPPKFINFCRGDAETSSVESDDENYSVAQFARTMNPSYRASSPQPSMFESHHDPNNPLARELGLQQDTRPILQDEISIPSRQFAESPQPVQPDHRLIQAQQEAQEEAQWQAQQEAQQEAQRQAQQQAQQEAQRQAQRQAQQEAQRQAQQEARQAQQEAQRQAQQQAQQEAQRQAQQEAQRQAQQEAQQEAQRQAQQEAQQEAQRQAEQQARQEAERQAQQQAQQKAQQAQIQARQRYQQNQISHTDNSTDGTTQIGRIGPPSDRSIPSPARPASRDSQSEYSNPTSFSSIEPPSGSASPGKPMPQSSFPEPSPVEETSIQKKRGFFNSPFARRKSKPDLKETPTIPTIKPSNRNTWAPSRRTTDENTSPTKLFSRGGRGTMLQDAPRSASPEPADPRANFQLNVGNNVFDVASPDKKKQQKQTEPQDELDPIAQALEELRGVTKQASTKMPSGRQSADRYHGLATPQPPGTPAVGGKLPGGAPAPLANVNLNAAKRGTPPPTYEQPPMSLLGAPKPAHTSRQMQKTTQMYVNQKVNMFNGGEGARSSSRSPTKQEPPRAASPAPARAASPRPGLYTASQGSNNSYRTSQQQQPQSPSTLQPAQRQPASPAASTYRPAHQRQQSSTAAKPSPVVSTQQPGRQQQASPAASTRQPARQQPASPAAATRQPTLRQQQATPAATYNRTASPNPYAAPNAAPSTRQPAQRQQQQATPAATYNRTASPNPYAASNAGARPRAQTTTAPAQVYGTPIGRNSYSSTRGASPVPTTMPRAASPQPPQPTFAQSRPQSRAAPASRAASPQPQFRQSYDRPSTRGSDTGVPLASAGSDRGDGSVHGGSVHGGSVHGGSVHGGSVYGGSVRGRGTARPQSSYQGGSGGSEFGFTASGGSGSSVRAESRARSKSLAEPMNYNSQGRVILNYSRAMYSYSAQIPEELGFQKGDILAVLRLQDDGWWEAEAVGKNGRPGLVPSNYLQAC